MNYNWTRHQKKNYIVLGIGVGLLVITTWIGVTWLTSSTPEATGSENSTLEEVKKTAESAMLLQVSSDKEKKKAKSEKEKKKKREAKEEETSERTAPDVAQKEGETRLDELPFPTFEPDEKKYLAQVEEKVKNFKYEKARQELRQLWTEKPLLREKMTSLINEVSSQILFSSIPWRSEDMYHIRKEDTFYRVSQKFNISVSLLKSLNPKVDATNLQVGQRLKVLRGPFAGRVEKKFFHLYLDNQWICAWKIKGKVLPPGKYKIKKARFQNQGQEALLICDSGENIKVQIPRDLKLKTKGLFGSSFSVKVKREKS